MVNMRREDPQMKIPALMHLSRLGYGYLSRTELLKRDRKTNFLPETLRTAVERINGVQLPPDRFLLLTEDLQTQLDAEDLGRQFYGTLRNGWDGLRLIDYDHPENNCFQSAAELSCGSGAGSFRPDITLYVNGLPLAMIEMKNRDRTRGLQAEYNRMQERFRGKKGKRYLQCAQIWAFSDDHADDPDRLLPTEGAFFTTVMAQEFPVYAVREKRFSSVYRRLLPRNAEEERRILEDAGLEGQYRIGTFRKSLSPQKATHRMLTVLFSPERFLFLLRYGIQYVREKDPDGNEYMTRRILTIKQLSALSRLPHKAGRGYRNWTVPACGAAGEKAVNASLVALLRDLFPRARLYWVSTNEEELRKDQAALESCGVVCAPREETAEGSLRMTTAEKEAAISLAETRERAFADRRVFILPEPIFRYGQETNFAAGLRRTDPSAILVTRITNQILENCFSAVLLQMSVRSGGNAQAAKASGESGMKG